MGWHPAAHHGTHLLQEAHGHDTANKPTGTPSGPPVGPTPSMGAQGCRTGAPWSPHLPSGPDASRQWPRDAGSQAGGMRSQPRGPGDPTGRVEPAGASPRRLIPGRRHHRAGFHGNAEPRPPRLPLLCNGAGGWPRTRAPDPRPPPPRPWPLPTPTAGPGTTQIRTTDTGSTPGCPGSHSAPRQHPNLAVLHPSARYMSPPGTAGTATPSLHRLDWRRAQQPLSGWRHREDWHWERPQAGRRWGHRDVRVAQLRHPQGTAQEPPVPCLSPAPQAGRS